MSLINHYYKLICLEFDYVGYSISKPKNIPIKFVNDEKQKYWCVHYILAFIGKERIIKWQQAIRDHNKWRVAQKPLIDELVRIQWTQIESLCLQSTYFDCNAL